MDKEQRDEQTYAILGAAMEVHNQLGPGFLEPVYQDALEIELTLRGIPFEREALIPMHYKGRKLKSFYKADFICYNEIVVELKALAKLTSNEQAQGINYLKATRLSRALLINFGAPSLDYKRLVFTHKSSAD